MAAVDANELFDAWDRAWSGRDPRGFESICHPEVHYEDPLTEKPLVGTRPLARHAKQLWKALPDARVNSTGESPGGGAGPARSLRMTIEEALPEPANPLGVDGIEFVEYATSRPQEFGALLERLGFAPAARHPPPAAGVGPLPIPS